MINYQRYKNEIKKSIIKVVDSSSLILGPEVYQLENELSKYFKVKFAVGVNSGTDALVYSLKLIGIKPGDEVICPVFTYVGTAGAIAWLGGKPVFVDIDSKTMNIDSNSVEKLISHRTKAIIPVHIYGRPANMEKILKISRRYKLKIIEDAAQAFGAEYNSKKIGSIGHLSCLSFFPSKILGAFGDGGMVLTDNTRLAKAIKMMRIDGASKARDIYYKHEIIGTSSRLHETQAATLRVQFKYLNQNLEHRKKIAQEYNKFLKGIGDLTLPDVSQDKENKEVYNLYTIRTNSRDKLKKFLLGRKIESYILYPKPLHFLDVFKYLGYKPGDFPEAEKAANQVLSLPISPFLSLSKVRDITKLIKKFFNGKK